MEQANDVQNLLYYNIKILFFKKNVLYKYITLHKLYTYKSLFIRTNFYYSRALKRTKCKYKRNADTVFMGDRRTGRPAGAAASLLFFFLFSVEKTLYYYVFTISE